MILSDPRQLSLSAPTIARLLYRLLWPLLEVTPEP
jgi:hypothetical protein